jgi:hypothetical protein
MENIDFIEFYVLSAKTDFIENLLEEVEEEDSIDYEALGMKPPSDLMKDYFKLAEENSEWRPVLIRFGDIKTIEEIFIKNLKVYGCEITTNQGDIYTVGGKQSTIEKALQINKIVVKPSFIE